MVQDAVALGGIHEKTVLDGLLVNRKNTVWDGLIPERRGW
jgi:hypothetical protein